MPTNDADCTKPTSRIFKVPTADFAAAASSPVLTSVPVPVPTLMPAPVRAQDPESRTEQAAP